MSASAPLTPAEAERDRLLKDARILRGIRWRVRADAAEAETARLREQVATLREALSFYKHNVELCRLAHSGGDAGRNALATDGGKHAARALAATTETREDGR